MYCPRSLCHPHKAPVSTVEPAGHRSCSEGSVQAQPGSAEVTPHSPRPWKKVPSGCSLPLCSLMSVREDSLGTAPGGRPKPQTSGESDRPRPCNTRSAMMDQTCFSASPPTRTQAQVAASTGRLVGGLRTATRCPRKAAPACTHLLQKLDLLLLGAEDGQGLLML